MSNETQILPGTEHNEWLQGLSFYRDDIAILEGRLLDVASGETSFEVNREIEHFQNQFIIQRNTMDELRHSIREHHTGFGMAMAKEDPGDGDGRSKEHEVLKDQYLSFEKVMNELRRDFNLFMAKRA